MLVGVCHAMGRAIASTPFCPLEGWAQFTRFNWLRSPYGVFEGVRLFCFAVAPRRSGMHAPSMVGRTLRQSAFFG